MRPDNPKCETCVAWNPPSYVSGTWIDGYCKMEPTPIRKLPYDWCMRHQTPDRWIDVQGRAR